MKKIIIGIVLCFVLFLGVILVVPSLIPSDVYKTRIESQLSEELGRDVAISGDVKLQTFPFIRAKTEGINIQNPQGFSDASFLSVKNLEARIKLLPLLSKRVEISGFELIEPKISLEKNAQGTANWEIAATDNEETPKTEEPFKRNGGFESLDPQIASFKLVSGEVTYSDAQSGQTFIIEDIDGSLALPGLDKALTFDLAFDYEGERAEIEAKIDTIRSFLDGKLTPFQADIQTAFAKANLSGQFLASENLDIQANVQSDISDFKAIQRLTPKTLPYIELLESVKSDGQFAFIDGILSVTDSDIQIAGDGLSANFTGDARLSDTPVLDGTINASLTKFAKLTPYLPENLPSLESLNLVDAKAVLSGTTDGFEAKNIVALVKADDFSADFKGVANVQGETVALNGQYTANANNLPNLAKMAKIDTPYAALVGNVESFGSVSYKNDILSLSGLSAKAENGAVNGNFSGDVSLTETPIVAGQFDLDIPDLKIVTEVLPDPVLYSEAVKTIRTQGRITTKGDSYILEGLSASLENGLLNGRFDGQASYSTTQADAMRLDGNLQANITDLRALAALGRTELPSDTESGSIFDTVSLNGAMSGTPKAATLKNANITFDKFKGKGDFSVKLDGPTPFLNADLNLEGLDLRPYMASYSAQNPTGEIQPWSEAPIQTAVFQSIDGQFNLTSPNVITDRISLGQTTIEAVLKDGRLNADMPDLSLYGGTGDLKATFDTAQAVPTLTMTMDFDNLEGNAFLSAIAGFTNASGGAATDLTISASGRSQAELMRNLNGEGLVALAEGTIKGIDAAEFLTGLDQAFKTRALPSGLGPSKVTAFKEIQALFKIENGVVKINDFDFDALGFAAAGGGTIDLGNQNIDFNFRPRLTGEKASNIAAFGIPLRFAGDFGSAKASLDTEFLGKIVAEKSRAEAAARIQSEVGGPLGSILGGVVGGNSTQNGSQSNGQSSPASPEDAIGNVLGGLLGGSNKPANSENGDSEGETGDQKSTPKDEAKKADEKKKPEDELKKALGSLFGE